MTAGLQAGHPGLTVELCKDGADKIVTSSNLDEWRRLVEHKRLHECDAQIAALRRGLCTGVPSQLLQLWTANEYALRVAGDPDIEVADLKKQTRFRRVAGGSAAAGRQREVEAMFWQCVERMSMSERSLLLKFSAGRLRLPCPLEVIIEGETDRMPTAHTCFFQLCLPPYESVDIMYEKLTTAIVAGMGFDESAV